MAGEIHSHKVSIGGENFQVRSDQSPRVIERIAGYIDFKMRETGSSAMTSDKFRMAVMAAMNIAGELFELKNRMEEADKANMAVEEKARLLTEHLDKAISGGVRS